MSITIFQRKASLVDELPIKKIASILGLAILINGCSSQKPTGRYDIDSDIAPDAPISVEHLEDAHPQYEPYSLGGNTNYTLRGEDYKIVKKNRRVYRERKSILVR
jgi:rare lipoprotein A